MFPIISESLFVNKPEKERKLRTRRERNGRQDQGRRGGKNPKRQREPRSLSQQEKFGCFFWYKKLETRKKKTSFTFESLFNKQKQFSKLYNIYTFKMVSFKVICVSFAVLACVLLQNGAEAKKKGDMIIVGGEHGCGPQLLLKTDKKKGDILVMNPCHKKKYEPHYIPVPVYHQEQHYDSGYGGHDEGHGYDMGGSYGGGHSSY